MAGPADQPVQPNFADHARLYGGSSIRAETVVELADAFQAAGGPALMAAMADPLLA